MTKRELLNDIINMVFDGLVFDLSKLDKNIQNEIRDQFSKYIQASILSYFTILGEDINWDSVVETNDIMRYSFVAGASLMLILDRVGLLENNIDKNYNPIPNNLTLQ